MFSVESQPVTWLWAGFLTMDHIVISSFGKPLCAKPSTTYSAASPSYLDSACGLTHPSSFNNIEAFKHTATHPSPPLPSINLKHSREKGPLVGISCLRGPEKFQISKTSQAFLGIYEKNNWNTTTQQSHHFTVVLLRFVQYWYLEGFFKYDFWKLKMYYVAMLQPLNKIGLHI